MVKTLPVNYTGDVGILKGHTDRIGFDLPDVEVQAGQWLSVSNNSGEYSFNVPIGSYTVYARNNHLSSIVNLRETVIIYKDVETVLDFSFEEDIVMPPLESEPSGD